MRIVVNAIFYVVRGGIAWNMLPDSFPPCKTVYDYFRKWRIDGTWKRIHERLRGDLRTASGRERQPSAAILDTQSVKTTDVGGDGRGYDANKKISGRKRHLLVDTMGLVLIANVHSAATQDYDGARVVLERLAGAFTRLRLIWADSIYERKGLGEWLRGLRTRGKLVLEIVRGEPGQRGFHVQPRRWVIERTFGWLVKNRRLVRDYEYLPETSETMIYVAMIRLMLKRLSAHA